MKDDFEKELINLVDNIGNQKEIFLVGEMNGRVGKKYNNPVVDPFREDVVDDNGKPLMETYSLKIANGFFSHKDIHQYTWI